MKRSLLHVLIVALLFGLARPAAAQDILRDILSDDAYRRVSVSGKGEVRIAPDQATVRFGVVTRDPNPEEARRRNAEASKNAMNAVRELDIPENKMQLETLRLEPVYEYNEQTQQREEDGYEAVRIATVELDDLEKLPTLVARVVQQGANRLEGIEYSLQDEAPARNEALRKAVLNARDKAELLAETLDEELGTVVRINEQSFDMPRPFVRMEQAMAKAEDAAPEPEAYAAGELEVRATVQVVFALERP